MPHRSGNPLKIDALIKLIKF